MPRNSVPGVWAEGENWTTFENLSNLGHSLAQKPFSLKTPPHFRSCRVT